MSSRQFFGKAHGVAKFRPRRAQLVAQVSDAPAYGLDVPLLSVKQVAPLLGVSVKQVYALIYEQGLPTRQVGGAVRIHQGELNDWTLRHRLHADESRALTPHL